MSKGTMKPNAHTSNLHGLKGITGGDGEMLNFTNSFQLPVKNNPFLFALSFHVCSWENKQTNKNPIKTTTTKVYILPLHSR